MDRKNRIEETLQHRYSPIELVVNDFSHQHSGGGDSHIEVYIVAEAFNNMSIVKKHRMIYNTLQAELDSGLHALKLQVFGSNEQSAAQTTPPRCKGGS